MLLRVEIDPEHDVDLVETHGDMMHTAAAVSFVMHKIYLCFMRKNEMSAIIFKELMQLALKDSAPTWELDDLEEMEALDAESHD